MGKKTADEVREARGRLDAIDSDTSVMVVNLGCGVASVLAGCVAGGVAGFEYGFVTALAAFPAVAVPVWTLVYARRAWLLARAAFVAAADRGAKDAAVRQEPAGAEKGSGQAAGAPGAEEGTVGGRYVID